MIAACIVLLRLPLPEFTFAQSEQTLNEIPGLEGIQVQYTSMRVEGAQVFFTGYVDISFPAGGVRIQADELQLSIDSLEFRATGNVVFDQEETRLSGITMIGDLDDGTGTMEDAVGLASGPIYFRARRVTQLEPGSFKVERGVVTVCRQAAPIWEFHSRSITLKPGSHATMTLPTFRVKGVPLLAFPYIYWPLRDDGRQTGFLLPSIGTSTNKGFMLSETFFLAIKRSLDLSFTWERYSRAGIGMGVQLRHALSENSTGSFSFYKFSARDAAEQLANRSSNTHKRAVPDGYMLTGQHNQGLPFGFQLRAAADLISDSEFVRLFRDDYLSLLQRRSVLTGAMSRSAGPMTLDIFMESNTNFITSTKSVIGRRLPEVEFRLRPTEVLPSVYFSVANLSVGRYFRATKDARKRNARGGSYFRADAFPEVSVQLSQLRWITFNPFFRWRSTYYSHTQGTKDFVIRPRRTLRQYYETGIEIVGPSFYKIFDTPSSGYSPALKHVIQPRIVYSRLRQLERDNRNAIIPFDEVDSAGSDRNQMQVQLISRLFAKRYPFPEADERQVWPLLEFTLERLIELPNEKAASRVFPLVALPYSATTRLTPTPRFNVTGRVDFTPDFVPGNYNLAGSLNSLSSRIGINWNRFVGIGAHPDDPSQVMTSSRSNEIGTNASMVLLRGSFTIGGWGSYDFVTQESRGFGASLRWNLQCCTIGGEFKRFNFMARQDSQLSVIIELAQVGQFGFGSQR